MKTLTGVLLLVALLAATLATAQTKISARSGSISLNIKKKKVPPILTISDIRFTDKNGNDRIDAFENCAITFSIANTGKGAAVNMKMNVANQSSVAGLVFDKVQTISTINVGAKLLVNISIQGTQNLGTGTAKFKIAFDEPLGFPPDEFEMKIGHLSFEGKSS